MYKKIIDSLFSMRWMAVAMLVFLIAIGTATILESKYDIQTAKIFIYNALWFETLLVYLGVNLIANIFKYKMYQREKMAMFAFHLSFIVILLGAGITRFFSFEGLMVVREGESSNFIYTSDPHLWFRINDGKMQYSLNKKLFLSEQSNNHFDLEVEFPNRKNQLKIEYVDFRKKQVDTLLINDSIKNSVLEIVTDGMKSNYVSPNGFVMVGDNALSFEKKDAMPGIEVVKKSGSLFVKTKLEMMYLPMAQMAKYRQSGQNPPDSAFTKIPTDSLVPFLPTTLYVVSGQQFVFKKEIQNAIMTMVSSGRKDKGIDILTLRISDGNSSKIVDLFGGIGQIPTRSVFSFEGLTYEMEYGSTRIDLPFSIACNDFRLSRYPGSQVASSFESDVTILDKEKNYTHKQTIFMNHVMDYRGYRFFQSSYDPDEKGTRLSVNHDYWGTNVTYVGYLLMAIGMIMSLFAPVGRFKELLSKIDASKKRNSFLSLLIILGSLFTNVSYAEEHNHTSHDGHNHSSNQAPQHSKPIVQFISEKHSDQLATLLVQDFDGRIVPLHTVCDQLLRKVYGKNTYQNKNAVQIVMSQHMYPPYWIEEKIISVPQAVRETLKLDNYASFSQLIGENGEFKWMGLYNNSHQKLESKRSEFDKKIIKLVERFQVLGSIFRWEYMKLIPLKNDPSNTWYVPLNMELMQKDSSSSKLVLSYLTSLNDASKNNKYGEAEDKLTEIKQFQKTISKSIIPSDTHVKLEVSYNKMNIFKNSMYSYFTLGIILLIIYFIRIFLPQTPSSEKLMKRIILPFTVLMAIIFIYHGVGVSMRWYISGHAPWSNGYEAVVFIAWVSMLAGFIFSRKNSAVIAGTAILAFFMLFVTELNLMDPEITPLQPVLKSYWLMIHVAIITGSYGFLGLGAILGFINQIFYIFRTNTNGKRITVQINEITAISELTITIGLFMLTIGTFLGGIWANESWGRYWGWDPKETWALVSVLVYAILLHLRYIPGLSSKFTFNLVSFWSYGAIIFTFFGVNFYLVGLHSYAQGEGLAEIPNWIFTTIYSFLAFSIISWLRYRKYKNKISSI
jgi:cytochrome c-type biogenesis protein CcsB